MEDMDMDSMEVEKKSLPNHLSNSFKRFGLKNSIQTSFSQDYVFQITPKDDSTLMAVSLSTNLVKLYSPMTGQYYGECRGHSKAINQIAFSGPSTPHALHSCSSDGTIRAWDTRTTKQVSTLSAGDSQEIFSFAFGGSGDNLLAAGCNCQVLFWDWRNGKQIACLDNSHMDDVTQVHFVPDLPNKLVSASLDGLMCIFGTDGNINDDEHLESVINVGTSIGKIGFFGESYQKLWCLTHIETLSIWDLKDTTIGTNFQDARSLASDSWCLDHVNYFVDCYSGEDECLWVIGGTNSGTLGLFPVDCKLREIGAPEAVLEGGHTDVVRCVYPMSSRGIFGWTGGEDGRLCCWFSNESPDINSSWTSNSLVLKSDRLAKKYRHHPY